MVELSNELDAAFSDYLNKVAAKLHKWVEPLSGEQFWQNPFSYGNSIGHLVLHLTGNLNYYIGARIAVSGYVRDRDREFTDTTRLSKEEVLSRFDSAVALASDTIRRQSAEEWMTAYSAERSTAANRLRIVLDCVAHADHHVGQIINLSRELRRTITSKRAS